MRSKDINLEGRVTGVKRGWKMIILDVNTGKDIAEVELPLGDDLRDISDVELIPYQMALLGQDVKFKSKSYVYHKQYHTVSGTEAELKILSGPLRGNSYDCSQKD